MHFNVSPLLVRPTFWSSEERVTTLCFKKVPTFILSVTLSNLNRFSSPFCITGKRIKFATKPIRHYPPHLRRVATLPWSIKNSNFWPPVNCASLCPARFFTTYWHHALYSIFGKFSVKLFAVYSSNTNFLSKSCLRRWIPCWLLTNTAVTSAVMNFRCHILIATKSFVIGTLKFVYLKITQYVLYHHVMTKLKFENCTQNTHLSYFTALSEIWGLKVHLHFPEVYKF